MSTLFPAAVDPPIVIPRNVDAAYIRGVDDKLHAIEQVLMDALVGGVHATFMTVHASSATLAAGDTVALAGVLGLQVTKGVAAAIVAAGGVFGVALTAAAPLGRVLVAVTGAISNAITGLPASANSVSVNTTTARLQAGAGTYSMGSVNALGMLTLRIGGGGSGGAPTGAASGSLFGSYPGPSVGQLDGVADSAAITCSQTNWTPAAGRRAPSRFKALQTTNATPTNLDALGITDERVVTIIAQVEGFRPSNGDAFCVDLKGRYTRHAAGDPVLLGSVLTRDLATSGSGSTWNAALVIDTGADAVDVQVSGGAYAINWSAITTMQEGGG